MTRFPTKLIPVSPYNQVFHATQTK